VFAAFSAESTLGGELCRCVIAIAPLKKLKTTRSREERARRARKKSMGSYRKRRDVPTWRTRLGRIKTRRKASKICNQAKIAAYSARVSSGIIERLFLPRKPGVCAYAAKAPMRTISMVTMQQSCSPLPLSLAGWMVMFMDQV
jgi:hypothetical protein